MESNDAVRNRIEKNYLVMKVNYSQDQPNGEFLSKYPPLLGYPRLYVLDAEGDLLHSQNTAVLEEGASYDEKLFVAFLEEWKPE